MLEKQERRAAYEAMEKQKKLLAEDAERKLQGRITAFTIMRQFNDFLNFPFGFSMTK